MAMMSGEEEEKEAASGEADKGSGEAPGEADTGGEEAPDVHDDGIVMEKGELKIRLRTVNKDNENSGGKKRERRYSPCYKPPPDPKDII